MEKTLKQQIIEKMIGTLNDSENFPDDLLTELGTIDLSNRSEVKEAISKERKEAKDEDTQAGN
ncbi:MAG: hypothetical protein WC996_05115 [Peptostreptococcales bacterium]